MGRSLEGRKILVVEDDEIMQRTLVRVLGAAGALVVSANGVADAMRGMEDGAELDAAVVDHFLVDQDGLQIIAALRAREQPCCALMITGSREVSTAREAIAAGAGDFLLKPFELQEFLNAVVQTVERTDGWRRRMLEHAGERESNDGDVLFMTKGSTDSTRSSGDGELRGGPLDLQACCEALVRRGGLSQRERDILVHILMGRRNGEIADRLGIKQRTVKFHVTNILKKLEAGSRGDLLRLLFDPS